MNALLKHTWLALLLAASAVAQAQNRDATVRALEQTARSTTAPATARLNALWLLKQADSLDASILGAALDDTDATVRKTALQIIAELAPKAPASLHAAVRARIADTDPRARLQAFVALGAFGILFPEDAQAIVAAWPSLPDKHVQSAALGTAAADPLVSLEMASRAGGSEALAGFVSHLSRIAANKGDPELTAKIITVLAEKPAATDRLKQAALESLAANAKAPAAPEWNTSLQSAFKSLLGSASPAVGGAALPLVGRWDKSGSMSADLRPFISQLSSKLGDSSLPDDARGQIAANLLGVRHIDSAVVPAVAGLLGSSASPALQRRVVESLGAGSDAASGRALLDAFPKVSPELSEPLFTQLLKRSDWSRSVVDALAGKQLALSSLGPALVHRLRTHADKSIAQRANDVINELRGPEQKQKDALIAQFRPEVEKPGNLDNGHKLFTAHCASCHVFKDEGRNLAPNLTGMGAHGAAELLVHILDPNRLVEPNFVSHSIETQDDLNYDGVIERENRNELVLRNATGDFTIPIKDIRTRRSTSLSLMPEGFEQLGPEGMRDLLAYICSADDQFRFIDLRTAFTTDSTKGIYATRESWRETVQFRRFGVVKANGVPFDIVHPTRALTGNNLIVLKGRNGICGQYPQRVEVGDLSLKAARLHFLGGVGGWAWPCCGDEKNEGLPVAKITATHSDGSTESWTLTNGVHIADYIGAFDVPESKAAEDVVRAGQVRTFARVVNNASPITKLAFESFNTVVAPTFVAVTAESGGGKFADGHGAVYASASGVANVAADASAAAPFRWGAGIKTLIAGGGASHDYDRWFNREDVATLSEGGLASANYTEQMSLVALALKAIDVLYLSNNKPFPGAETHRAIMDFAHAGKGIVIVHAAGWFNWKDFPDYHRELIGGGSRSHDKYGEFEVTVTDGSHPLMRDVPANFTISDELYHFIRDDAAAPMRVLATGKSPHTGKVFPVVWITQHPHARVANITLGHDGKAHQLPAFRTLLRNAIAWAAAK